MTQSSALEIENFEIMVTSNAGVDSLLLTFDAADAPDLPQSVTAAALNQESGSVDVFFGDDRQIRRFPGIPADMVKELIGFGSVVVAALAVDGLVFSGVVPLELA